MADKVKITEVSKNSWGFSFAHSDHGGFGVAKENWPEDAPQPKVGDTLTVYPGVSIGTQVTGVDLNGIHVFRQTAEEIEADRLACIAEYDAQQKRRVAQALMEQRRQREWGKAAGIERRTICIGGMSPDYENACQVMLMAAEQWQSERKPPFTKVDADSLGDHVDKACPGGGASGAMVGAVVSHTFRIRAIGRDEWLREAERRDPARLFVWDGTAGSCVKVCS